MSALSSSVTWGQHYLDDHGLVHLSIEVVTNHRGHLDRVRYVWCQYDPYGDRSVAASLEGITCLNCLAR